LLLLMAQPPVKVVMKLPPPSTVAVAPCGSTKVVNVSSMMAGPATVAPLPSTRDRWKKYRGTC